MLSKKQFSAGVDVSRRSLLGLLAIGSLAGCAATVSPPRTSPSATATPTPSASPTSIDLTDAFQRLESQFDARLGVWAVDTATGTVIAYRAGERFAFCSTAKAFLAGLMLQTHSDAQLEAVVRYSADELPGHSPITTENLRSGMTLRALCDAAVRYSDNGAANILYRQVGGPGALQTFVRGMGDETTDMSRIESALNSATPGDVRDTTTPEVWGADFRELVLGTVLPPAQKTTLVDWLLPNTLESKMIRTAAPAGWTVADKTGQGSYGTRNDIGVVWPPDREPLVLAIMSSRSTPDASVDDDLLAQAAAATITALN